MAFSTPPATFQDILATGIADQAFTKFLQDTPPPEYDNDITIFKKAIEASLPARQQTFASTRPETIIEREHIIPVDDSFQSRVIICQPIESSGPTPLVVLYHGGGHCLGFPEFELDLARQLVTKLSVTVVLPSYKLAPEHPFPGGINSAWEVLKYLAAESQRPHDPKKPLFTQDTNPKLGFIVGGTSAGAELASVLAHLARDNQLSPPLTGQFLSCGSYISPDKVPFKYQPLYLSWEQNKNAPVLDRKFMDVVSKARAQDPDSPLAYSFDQHHPEDGPGEVKQGHLGLPPAFFQVCGLDPTRDDNLIYERVCGRNAEFRLGCICIQDGRIVFGHRIQIWR
ncbi:alpha/beta-hydrolase [Microthyrium microscopicum]|uniref:Alpha/beta-hydrolase n=1 Tax=Microthyrium microscopicum TaxID=703497 RepID=A0A6A6TXY9_9PEZI|nr:alpha/beta-hydrolase [Microthyrium microscopicum]